MEEYMKLNVITKTLLVSLTMSNGLVTAMAGDINPTPEMVQGFAKGFDYVQSTMIKTPQVQSAVIQETAAVVQAAEVAVQPIQQTQAVLTTAPEINSSWQNVGEGFKALGSAGLHYVKATGKLIADLPWPNITNVFKNSCQDVQMFVNDVTKNKTIFVVTLALAGYGSYKLYNKVIDWYNNKQGFVRETRQTQTSNLVTRTEVRNA